MNSPDPAAPDVRPTARGLLLAYVALSPAVFWYGLVEPFESCKSALAQLTAVALVALGFASRGLRLADLRGLFRGPVGIAVLCGAASAALSTALSVSPTTSLYGALDSGAGLGSALALVTLFAAARSLLRGEAAAEQVSRAAAVGLALSCAYALVQALGHDPVRWATVWEYRGWPRPNGTQGHPNYLAGHAVLALPLVLLATRRATGGRRWAGAALVVVAALTVVLTLSRSAALAGGLAILVLLAGWQVGPPRRWALPLLLFPAAACVLVALGPDNALKSALVERAHGVVSSPGRWPIWEGALRLFARHPWTGAGLDTFGLAWPAVRGPDYWRVEWGFLPLKAHNDFLHALATQGLVGATAYLLLPAALLVSLARAWRAGVRRDWVAALAGVAVAFYAQNVFGFAVASTSGLMAVVAGLVAGLGEEEAEPVGASLLPPAAWLGVAVILLGLWQGGGHLHPWRLALAGLALAWAAAAGLALGPERHGPAWSPCLFRAWRCLPASLGAAAAAWWVVCPLVASALSFRAEQRERHDPAAALTLHDQAVWWAPQAAHLHERRAKALWRGGWLLDAATSAETAVRLEPLSARLHATRARLLFDLAREGLAEPGDVLAAFGRALALDRHDWFALADAARAAAALGELEMCERLVEGGLAEEPGLGLLLAERAALELARGRLDVAERAAREALEANWFGEHERRDRTSLLLGTVLFEKGKAAEALAQAEAVQRRRDWEPARRLLARCRERLAAPRRSGAGGVD